MATSANQILDASELENKLGGNSGLSASLCPDKSQINSIWGSAVYIKTSVNSNNMLPNNGEVWPQKTLKFNAQNPTQAYSSGTTKSVNFRNASWSSSSLYSIDIGDGVYEQESSAANGYYMTTTAIGGYYTYYDVRSGLVNSIGSFQPHYFNWAYSGSIQYAEIGQGSSYINIPYNTNETNINVVTTRKYNSSNTLGGNDNIAASISGSNVRFRRTSIDSNYPFTEIVINGSHGGLSNYYHNFLLAPNTGFWTLSCSNISNEPASGREITPSVNTNMDSYTMSSSDSWISINNNTHKITILANPSGGNTRTATVNLTGYIDTSIGGAAISGSSLVESIDYEYTKTGSSFTITQNAPNTLIYILVDEQERSTCYVSTVNNDFNHLINAPKKIFINNIVVRVGNQTYPGSCEISQGSSTGTIDWDYGMPTDQYITFDSVGDVMWEYNTPPTGYEFGNMNLIWK